MVLHPLAAFSPLVQPTPPPPLSFSIPFPNTNFFPKTPISISLVSKPRSLIRCISTPNVATSSSAVDIEMVRTKEGIYAPKRNKVVVLWDLDNKPPRGPPYEAALALKRVASRFGDVVDIAAYANRHAFIHLPTWVVQERRERRNLDVLERKGMVTPENPYICSVCGRKCKTNLDLKKHFIQLHERERQKKLSRMKQLKGKKRQKFKERYIAKNHKFEEAARNLITPKVGYGLARELRRAGVYVKTVEDKPQAADWALKRQMMHSMTRGIDWLFLVSDDSDFADMLMRARESSLGTVVVGDQDRSLGRHADLWVPWIRVEKGELKEEDLVPRRRTGVGRGDESIEGDELFSLSGYEEISGYDGSDLDRVVDELVGAKLDFEGVNFSAFSEGEWEDEGSDVSEFCESSDDEDDYLLDSDEEDGYD